ncbi:MAG TPA: cytochrome P450, partial [Mycobacteriales bacterium]|nr:cytochrome P450 [Mycobacteriales bacterium]
RDHEPTIRRICHKLVADLVAKGGGDFVWDVAAPLPLLLIADMLGFPPESYDDLLEWSDDMIRGTTRGDEAAAEKAMFAGIAFREFQLGVIADRRSKPPQDDLVSILCYADIDGERLDDESIIQESLLILIGGDETTRHVISGGMLALIEHPDQRDRLAAHPEGMEVAVEELLRWITPIKNMSRTVTKDVELAGKQLHEGDQLILLYPSANRDEAVFERPDELDLTRHPNPHLAFGFGPHFCLGASLARLELRVMFDEVLRQAPTLRLAEGTELPYRASNFIVGLEAMPVEVA